MWLTYWLATEKRRSGVVAAKGGPRVAGVKVEWFSPANDAVGQLIRLMGYGDDRWAVVERPDAIVALLDLTTEHGVEWDTPEAVANLRTFLAV